MIIMRERTAGAMASSRDAVAVAESGCEERKVRVEIGGVRWKSKSGIDGFSLVGAWIRLGIKIVGH